MLIHQTMDKLSEMKLSGFLTGLREQMDSPQYQDLSFEERLGLLVDKEYLERENRRLTRRLREAQLRIQAEIEDVNFQLPRGLNKKQLLSLAAGSWIHDHHNLIITGPTGVGKTYLACSLARKACHEGYRTLYRTFPDLIRELALTRADGSYPSLAAKIAKRDLLIIDDWLRDTLSAENSRHILDLIDDRFRTRSTLLVTQLPVADWHKRFKDPTIADAVLDRLVHDSYRIELKGESMRKKTSNLTKNAHLSK